MRFLSGLNPHDLKNLDDLNQRFFKWLEDDYKRKAHKGLNGLSPHDVLMSKVSELKLITDVERINENFLLRITRKIQPDATTQIDNILYETDSRFSSQRVEIRYEPEWLNDVTRSLPIYEDGKKVGEARMVRFHDNARAMRKFKGNRRKNTPPEIMEPKPSSDETVIKNSISYSDLMGRKHSCSDNTLD
jgi:hypothetical protein